MARRDYRGINATVRYTMFSVFQVRPGALDENPVTRSVALLAGAYDAELGCG
jgi:hypothetical protein